MHAVFQGPLFNMLYSKHRKHLFSGLVLYCSRVDAFFLWISSMLLTTVYFLSLLVLYCSEEWLYFLSLDKYCIAHERLPFSSLDKYYCSQMGALIISGLVLYYILKRGHLLHLSYIGLLKKEEKEEKRM